MVDFNQLSRDFNSSGAELLLTDLDVAMTFMDVAATTQDPVTVRRNHDNARLAYTTVLGFMRKLVLTEAERQSVEAKLDRVRARLSAAGYEV